MYIINYQWDLSCFFCPSKINTVLQLKLSNCLVPILTMKTCYQINCTNNLTKLNIIGTQKEFGYNLWKTYVAKIRTESQRLLFQI